MEKTYWRPEIGDVKINDDFWTPFLKNIRNVTIPYCFEKFKETGYIDNFAFALEEGKKHVGPPFSDGLVLETVRAASDFLKDEYDEKTDELLDEIINIIVSAQCEDGYLCTQTVTDYPQKKWGENGGDIIHQHDLYNQGALVEAAISHYCAMGKTKLLIAAVKSANNICSYIGKPPKHNIIPGHSLPEEAFVKLYRLFRDRRELDGIATEYDVKRDEYLEIARFWYDNRGNYEGRTLSPNPLHGPHYNQDTEPFAKQKTAMGHAVRACLCYLGAAAVAYELKIDDYKKSLDFIWNDVTKKKLHISGGIGARKDIEGFDSEYNLPNNAYLETCAGTAFAFWAGEMSLLKRKSEYFDYFELSLYNNILGSLGKDFKSFYYDNSLVNDGTKNRWSWHGCPCCPPMLAKLYSSLATYIYSCCNDALCVNMYIGSEYRNANFYVCQKNGNFEISAERNITVYFRIPEYAENFEITVNGKIWDINVDNGYAKIDIFAGKNEICIKFGEKLRLIFANSLVEADRGKVCVMNGKYLMCVEGADNGGNVDKTLASFSSLERTGENVTAESFDGEKIFYIPYWKRNNRVNDNTDDSRMAVWLPMQNMEEKNTACGELYGEYR